MQHFIRLTLSAILLLTFHISFPQGVRVTTIHLDAELSLDGLLMTPDGVLYGTEGYDGTRLFKIDLDGTTSVVATGLNGPIDLDYDTLGHLYLSTFNNRGIFKITPGVPFEVSRLATVANGPSGVVVNRSTGDIFISHYGTGFPGNGKDIYKVATDGTSAVFVQGNGLNVPVSLAIDEEGNLYAPNIGDAKLFKITPAGDISLLVELPTSNHHPFNIGHIAYANGFLYLTSNQSLPYIYKVGLSGDYEIIAGDGTIGYKDGPGLEAQFNGPNGIATSVTGDTLFVSELNQPGLLRMIILPSISQSLTQTTARFMIHQNYPNPFYGKTTITFDLPEALDVNISVYNAQGQLVKVLLNEFKNAGSHTITWEMKDMSAGTYFYRMKAGGAFAEMKAMALKKVP